ncbi:transcription factor ATOH8 isoform X2 [Podarcis raffonei]|uniref:transcription factor ATOH8 isoform X2 n=1 Tax=Podarcis raffonei TaxID=65483 RepID=UPI00232909AC|nr:transcription factor ATOH8 isoform X2 [Podarcis raffonei]
MRNLPLAGDEERWGRLCLKELGGIQKLHRKRSKEPAKQRLSGGGGRSSRAASAGAPDGGAAEAGAEARKGAFPAGLLAPQPRASRKDVEGPLRLGGGQAFADPSLPPPRVMACRPLESPFPPASRVPTYGGGGGEASLSPGRRAGEAAGASPEIRAIQQTRRLLANARERTRVHTISAAFEALRKQVPCYSYGQKLSKLAILRIACNYILSLARLANLDYSADHSNMSFSECVEQCTRTLQAEGRSKKRKE